MNKFPTSWVELDRGALKQNYQFLRKFLNDGVRISSVVKGNAYGHGIESFVPLVLENGVDHFSVFSAEEAYKVHQAIDDKADMMIMGMMDDEATEWAIEKGVEFYVFDFNRLRYAIKSAKAIGKKAKIHLEVETGMHRTGFEESSLSEVVSLLKKSSDLIELKGMCTHYAGAESMANYYRVMNQQRNFKRITKNYSKYDVIPETYHTACSAASMRFPKTQMDMVRLGIVQYGFFPTREVMIDYMVKNKTEENPLKRVLSWKSRVMDVKEVQKGEFIGYGTSYIAHQNQKVATVPVGYSNGFSRSLSNQGRVLINGQRVSVIGTVNMNMITVDATNLPSVEKGDEVVIIGEQGDMEISVSSFAEFSDQVNYELLTRLPLSIDRRII